MTPGAGGDPTPAESVEAASAEAWRAWLAANHEHANEVWLIYHRKSSGVPSITWEEAVVEAIRFGWIDGVRRGLDPARFVQRFTPRRPRSRWSKINRTTAERLIAEGAMSPAGLRAVEAAQANGEWDSAYTVPPKERPPEELRVALGADPALRARFRALTVTRHNRCVAFVAAAADAREREERVERVLAELRDGGRFRFE